MYLKNFIVIFFGLFIFCCNPPKMEEEIKQPTDTVDFIDSLQSAGEEFPIILPSPLQIANIFKKSGLTYFSEITNPPANATKYLSKIDKLLNFGVYTADIAYCVLNEKSQKAREYIKVIKQLAEELGMANAFDKEKTFDNFEKNIGNIDSLTNILVSIQEQMDKYLDETNQEYLTAVFFTGAWIEGMYFGSKEIQEKENEFLTKRIVEQMSILENLIKGLQYYPDKTDELNRLITQLSEIKDIYKNFSAIKNIPEDEEIPFEKIVITDEELNRMAKKIEEIRREIVQG